MNSLLKCRIPNWRVGIGSPSSSTNNEELMLYRFRNKSGEISPYSSGTYVDAKGVAHHLTAGEITFTPGRLWRKYPVDWQISDPVDWSPSRRANHPRSTRTGNARQSFAELLGGRSHLRWRHSPTACKRRRLFRNDRLWRTDSSRSLTFHFHRERR